MGKFGIVFIGLTAAAALSLGFIELPKLREKGVADIPKKQSPSNQAADYSRALSLLEANQPEEALSIIHKYKNEIETHSQDGIKWLQLFILASEESKDIPQLIVIFEFFPEIFKEHESASLLVADSYLMNNRDKDFKKIRSLWKDRETKIASWMVLDVDALLLEGRRQEAKELLKSRTFKDKADVGRLIRLALLSVDEDPKLAWKYLGEAYAKDPQNPDVRIYRAKLLESVGKYRLAEKEYQSAARLNPKNIYMKENLANFYLRHREYPEALKVLSENLAPPSLDNIWVKALFWNKVAAPLDIDWKKTPPPQGKLEPLIQYLAGLGSDTFWNEEKFTRVKNHTSFLKTQQETFWLRLLNALKNKEEKQALDLLNYNPFLAASWFPELETALKRVLNYRVNRSLEISPAFQSVQNILGTPTDHLETPRFFELLDYHANAQGSNATEAKLPDPISQFLLSSEIFSALFIASGWLEAGLQLHQLPVIPDEFPDWVAVNLTQALNKNRSTLEAIQFAAVQKPTPELTLLNAELLIAGGDSVQALEKLNTLAILDSSVGYRAAWLASLIYIDDKDWKSAKNTIIAQPRLVNDLLGKETLARIAHLEGDPTLAAKLYAAIEKISPEARSYLARKAFADKDWTRAQQLTEQLLEDYPDNPLLQENLKRIAEEQQKQPSRNARAG